MRYTTLIRLHGKTATGIEVPPSVLDALGGGRRPAVRVTINGHSFATSVGSMGGQSLIPVSADVRSKAGVSAGDEVTVDVERDDAPRTVTIPPELAAAMRKQPAARRSFDSLSYSAQRRHVESVEGAKTEETRQRRVEKVVAALLA